MRTTFLPAPSRRETASGEDYAAWLGVSQERDAAETIAALTEAKPDWLVVDHYGLDAEWEERVRSHVVKLMVIDDRTDRRHDCDVLLNQNYSTDGGERSARLVGPACMLLSGPRYALLREEYLARRRLRRQRDGRIRRVLVFFGGSDPANMTSLALGVLSAPEFSRWECDVVVGANHPNRKAIEEQASGRPLTTVHGPREHLADFMMQADLAIGAVGTTTWERMCLGLPTVAISIADNQRPVSEALATAGLIKYVGHMSDANSLSRALRELTNSEGWLTDTSATNEIVVDGLGLPRVVETLLPTNAGHIRLRRAGSGDVISYFNWANDREVRRNANHSGPIEWSTHTRWFAEKLCDPAAFLFVLEADGLPVGQIRFDIDRDEARIDYSVDAIVRGRGWGTRLVQMGTRLMTDRGLLRFRADVKEGNHASRAVFVRLGFTQAQAPDAGLSFHSSYPGSVKAAG